MILFVCLVIILSVVIFSFIQGSIAPSSQSPGRLSIVERFWADQSNQPEDNVEEEEAVQVLAPFDLDEEEVVSVQPIPTKFSEYKYERERLRSRQQELLEAVIYDSTYSEQQRIEAQADLMKLLEVISKETEVENLLKARGFTDVVAVLNENSVIVVVPTELARDEVSKIGDLVQQITGLSLGQITIVDEFARS